MQQLLQFVYGHIFERHILLNGKICCCACGLPHDHAGHRNAHGCQRFVGRADAAACGQQIILIFRHQNAVGNVVAAIAPFSIPHQCFAGGIVNVDGVGADANAVFLRPVFPDVLLGQGFDSLNAAAFTHAGEGGYALEPAVFKAGQVFPEKCQRFV